MNTKLKPTMKRVFRAATIAFGILFAVLVALGLIGFAWFRYTFPYGMRSCLLSVMSSALAAYAQDNGGWYPAGGATPLESLQKLYTPEWTEGRPYYLGDPILFAGISGDEKKVRERLKANGALDSSISSWVYFPDFNEHDDGNIALLSERAVGVGFGGHRAEPGSHAVSFNDGSGKMIAGAKWDAFLAEQERLRQEVILGRRAGEAMKNRPVAREGEQRESAIIKVTDLPKAVANAVTAAAPGAVFQRAYKFEWWEGERTAKLAKPALFYVVVASGPHGVVTVAVGEGGDVTRVMREARNSQTSAATSAR